MIIINDDYRDHEKPDTFRYIIQGNVYRIALQYTRLNRFKIEGMLSSVRLSGYHYSRGYSQHVSPVRIPYAIAYALCLLTGTVETETVRSGKGNCR